MPPIPDQDDDVHNFCCSKIQQHTGMEIDVLSQDAAVIQELL